ncbi:hypothetical protein QSJ19_01540 [Gordonia sp. ABSL11-1]|uniref:hypothetical protein n=1 Tax=Gordonia sp. ABSL11-1 TaxID=3053924 RepID=UPI0025746F14|nr:hypothetical protein [Gordonia sp. ABSL11-1]MDL9944286.1 hypothetical protein [Gordonia sp. ABSL11-1]
MTRILLALGVVLLIATGVAGFKPITVDSGRTYDSDTVSCGSWFSRDDTEAKKSDIWGTTTGNETSVDQCEDAISDRTPIVAVLGIAAIAALLGAAITNNGRR